MFQNYCKIALRNLWKHKLFSAINIFGFASGLTVCFLAIAHIKAVFEYDAFHPKRDRIYRIITDVMSPTKGPTSFATSPMGLASTLKKDYPGIEETARVVNFPTSLTGNDKRLDVTALAVDPGFFSLFHFQLATGRLATEPLTAVISPQTANRYFGTTNPVGKVFHHETLGLITITGVLAEVPVNSHFKFDLLLSLSTLQQGVQQTDNRDWQKYTNGFTYVLLKPLIPPDHLQQVLSSLIKRINENRLSENRLPYHFRPQALSQLSPSPELLSRRMVNEKHYGDLIGEFFVGLVTLLLAGFNYVNLTLARSIGRAREVGVRKVVGAFRWQVMGQFMTESVGVALLALALAYGMAVVIRPMPVVRLWLLSELAWDFRLWMLLIGFSLLAGVLAGWAPARILSGIEPAQVFRSYSGLRVIRGLSFRKALIVAQFTISLIVMMVLVTLSRQFHFFSTADYGFRRERLLTIPLSNRVQQQRLSNELRQVTGVERVTATSALLSELNELRYVKNERYGHDSARTVQVAVDTNFVQTMNLSLVAGQNFPNMTGTVPHQRPGRLVLINEKAVGAFRLGSPTEAIGRTLWLDDSLGLLGMVTYTTQLRVKEIGIRKVMGATVFQLFNLLSWDFIKLLLIAFLIAYPLGYIAGNALLSNFAYRVSIGFETFGLCCGLLVILGSLTIGIRTYRAAQANPTKNLRTE
ncbi:ABC transporter permease [Larkinella sp. VNQ87]|uniref:ABC transporter permease n=1 Tax=Larkinella sp. VNQ87 TaxID=3400921 RepID=UPI003C06C099